MNFDDEDLNIFKNDLEYHISTELTAKYVKYGIICPNGMVFDRKLNIIKESLLSTSKITVPNKKFIIGELLTKKIKLIKGDIPYIVAFSFWSVNYFHWLTDTLTRLLLIKEADIKNSVLLIPSNFSTPFFKESLKIIGFTRIATIEPNEVLLVKSIVIPPYTAQTGYFHPLLLQYLSRRFIDFSIGGLKFSQKIYISREKADKRKVLNEHLLFPILEKEGFTIVCFEDFSFYDQVSIMKNSTHLISIHGAGLTNMLFMQKGSNILELRKEGETDLNCYFIMASALEHHYYYLQCKPGSAEDHYTHLADLKVDVEKFALLLKEFSSN